MFPSKPMSTTSLRALTVLVVPRAQTEEIIAVLADYSAVGLLAAFAWVDAADVGGASTPATVVRDADDIGAIEHCRHPDTPDVHNVVDVYLMRSAAERLPVSGRLLAPR